MAQPIIKNHHRLTHDRHSSREMVPQTSLVQSRTITRTEFDRGMSWPELKTFASVISQLTSKDQRFTEFTTSMGDLCKLANLGEDSGRYRRVHEFLRTITTRGVVLPRTTSMGKTEWIYTTFLAMARYDIESKRISFRLNEWLQEHLLKLKSYTLIPHLKEFLQLESAAQGRLYMLACDCRKLWNPALRTFSISDLLGILGLDTPKDLPNWKKADRIRRIHRALRGKSITLVFYLRTTKKDGQLMFRLDFPTLKKSLPHKK